MNRSLLVLALFSCASAWADSSTPVIDSAVIDNSGQQYSGNLSVNQAAGDLQQQINSRAIAIGPQAQASNHLAQALKGRVDPALDAKAAILGNSFSHGSGVVGVNQSAGANNQTINALRISLSAGPQSVDDSVLSQQNVTLIPSSGATNSASGSRQVVTSDQAFTGSRGVVQLSQSAGVGNQIANTLSIRVAD